MHSLLPVYGNRILHILSSMIGPKPGKFLLLFDQLRCTTCRKVSTRLAGNVDTGYKGDDSLQRVSETWIVQLRHILHASFDRFLLFLTLASPSRFSISLLVLRPHVEI